MKPIRVPDLAPKQFRRIGKTVPLHPQRAVEDYSCPEEWSCSPPSGA